MERVIDAAQPTKLDPADSYAIDGSFFISHTENCLGDIEIEVGSDHADLISEVNTRRITAAEFGGQWIEQTAPEVDRMIRGRYRIS